MEEKDIDLVYTWVDGNDPLWREKKLTYTGKISDNTETNNIGRYVSNDELKYSLRSAEKYVPWIRKIFIVTDDQKPEWLNTNHPKIQVIDHKDIMPAEILPCFNSTVIDYFIYRIPGLSEHFLLANDDFFFNAPLSPEFFFAKDGFPIIRFKRKIFGKLHFQLKPLVGKKLGQYASKIFEGALLVEKKWGKYYPGVPHHNVDAYRKSDLKTAIEDVFNERIKTSQIHRTREYGDLGRHTFSFYTLAIGHSHLKYVGRSESLRIPLHRKNLDKYIKKYKPSLFCLNDSQKVRSYQRERIIPFLSALFPEKSAFEL